MARMKVPDSKGTDRLWDNIKAFLAENYAAADHTHDGLNAGMPYIGSNGTWYIWNAESQSYVDSGVSATQIVDINSGKPIKIWTGSIEEYNSLKVTYSDVLYYILEGEATV